MTPEITNQNASTHKNMSANSTQYYIVDMLEELMLMAQGNKLSHIANGLDDLLEPYRS
ncbi:MAG: hypothetical protein ABJG88_07205 [Litorimonas sp.]